MSASTRLQKLSAAIDERTGLSSLKRGFLGQPQHGAPSWGRALGAASLALFLFVCATGVALAFIYSPSTASAWASVAHLETRVPLGSFIRSAHALGTSALFITLGLHLIHIFATAAYRRPREAGWLIGLATLLVLPLFAITGNLLPMDEDGYWGAMVELEVIRSAPLGGLVSKLLIGGDQIGNATLTRFYTLHTLILPTVVLGLAGLHILVARKRKAADGELSTPRFPGQTGRDALIAAALLGLVALLAALIPTRLDAPADPANEVPARPEWYFAALNQLNTMGGSLLGLIVPALAIGFLAAIPWLDRHRPVPGQPPTRAFWLSAAMAALVAGWLSLTVRSQLGSDPSFEKAALEAEQRAATALATFAKDGVDDRGRLVVLSGHHLYVEKGCGSCHDDPEVPAPRLAGWATVERTDAFLAAPDSDRFFAKTPLEGLMEPFPGDAGSRLAVANYLLADTLPTRPDPELVRSGRRAFEKNGCTDCHNDPEVSPRTKQYDVRATGPDLLGYANREWTRALIRDANHPTFFGGAIAETDLPKLMPAYPELTNDELHLIVEWLMAGAPGAR